MRIGTSATSSVGERVWKEKPKIYSVLLFRSSFYKSKVFKFALKKQALFYRLNNEIHYSWRAAGTSLCNVISQIKIRSQPCCVSSPQSLTQFVSAGLGIPEEILAQGGHQRAAQWGGGVGGPRAPQTRYYPGERYGGHAVRHFRHFITALKARPCNFWQKK